MATSAKKIPSLIGEAVETGVDIIKGTKRQPLETVDYTQTTWLDDLQGARKDKSVAKADDTKPSRSKQLDYVDPYGLFPEGPNPFWKIWRRNSSNLQKHGEPCFQPV